MVRVTIWDTNIKWDYEQTAKQITYVEHLINNVFKLNLFFEVIDIMMIYENLRKTI